MKKLLCMAAICAMLLTSCGARNPAEQATPAAAIQTRDAAPLAVMASTDATEPATITTCAGTTSRYDSTTSTIRIATATNTTTLTEHEKEAPSTTAQSPKNHMMTTPSSPVTTASTVKGNLQTTATTPKTRSTTTIPTILITQQTSRTTEPTPSKVARQQELMDIGSGLSHDGTDYGKAKAVYDWMLENGHGTCVSFSYMAYYVCKGIGLACYYAQTDAKLYGHVANTVKVDGIWYILDTQAKFFLDFNYGFTEVVDETETVIGDGTMISDDSYRERYGSVNREV